MNFVAETYKSTLKKLISLVDLFYNSLKALILSLDSVHFDPYLAKVLCHLCFVKGGELQIFFVTSESKAKLIGSVFQRDQKRFRQLSVV